MKTENKIEFTKINRDINGNPRYVSHFFNLLKESEKGTESGISGKYNIAVKRANTIGGRKYNTKSFGGGIVFQSHNITDTEKRIKEILKES